MTRVARPASPAAPASTPLARCASPRRAPAARRCRGVALLTVLLLVAVMGTLLVAVLDDIRFGLRRAGNAQAVAQAQWYALGATTLARSRIAALSAADPTRTTLAGDWNGRTVVLPLDDAGRIIGSLSARIDDGTACFNLNSVVEGAPEQWQRHAAGVGQYLALQRAIGIDAAQATRLADALVDWIDSDDLPLPAGAEDADYAARGLRTSGGLLAEASELRAIAGYDPDAYARLRPYVCALPVQDLSPVNVNTLRVDDAPSVQMLAGDDLGREAARRILAARPAAGWADNRAFWAAVGRVPDDALLAQPRVRTDYFRLHGEVDYDGAQVVVSALLERDGGGRVRVASRRWSADE